ncbi:Cupin domain protein [Kaistia soli DSM 19436]|uniref:Cupin domain protein n=1 Tax=Kaistia soli DSM 19436 TaxID=1122133 RepID=A0A1M5A4I5_9HYPH|nr:cupin domain-containing protein [Kaistia soli]SHF25125.1 Cupin domain protein [Kaistia soli DSM 19436]
MPALDAHRRINPADEIIATKGLTIRFLLTGEDSNGSIASFELMVPHAGGLPVPAHSHGHYEESIYGLEGVLSLTIDGEVVTVGPGELVCIPRGAIHRFDNKGTEDARVLCVITPAAIGPAYFREAFAVISDAAGGPPDRARMMEIMRRHGLTPAAPPTL